MKSLVIYNSRIANINSYDDDIDFSSISSTLNILDTKEFDVIYIKDSLTLNYLDFIGIELAYHIRFTQKFKYIPIIILSDLDGFTLSKLTAKAQILFTKNTFLNKAPKDFPIFDDNNYKAEFLDKIIIEQPKDTSGTHGIANKWSIYRWSDLLKVESEATNKNKVKIENMLYFKYLEAQYQSRDGKKVKKIEKLSGTGKVLFIDDEWDKGWSDILNTAFYSENINFKTFKYDYQDKSELNLFMKIQTAIKDFDPDVVILDLRLSENDHDTYKSIDDFLGMDILKKIHEVNPGIQVIMMSATSKSIILEKLYEKKILGYIKKEHPNDYAISTAENINKLLELVDKGLDDKYLKKVFSIKSTMLKILKDDPFSKYIQNANVYEYFFKQLKKEINYIFDILSSNTSNKYPYALLSMARSLEVILSIFITERRHDNMYWDNSDCVATKFEDKIIALMRKFGHQNEITYLNSLIMRRNGYIHSNSSYIKPTKKEIIQWFNILCEMIQIIDNPPNYTPYVPIKEKPIAERQTITTKSGLRIKV